MGRPKIPDRFGRTEVRHYISFNGIMSEWLIKRAENNGTTIRDEIRSIVEAEYKREYLREYHAARKRLRC